MNSFNPNSPDAMFTKIIEHLEKHDDVLARIEIQTTKTNGRVNKMERFQTKAKAVIGAIVFAFPALGFAIERGWIHLK